MKYRDGKKVLLGDLVFSYNQKGIVVIDFDSDNYSNNFAKNDWESLKNGVLIRFDKSSSGPLILQRLRRFSLLLFALKEITIINANIPINIKMS